MNGLQLAHEYLEAIEAGGDIAKHYAPNALQHEYPNGLVPGGATRDLPAIIAASERGKRAVRDQHYEVHSALTEGDQVALRVTWRATLLVPLGKTPAGEQVTAHFAVFLRFRDGKIVEQHNYDCFPPF